MSAVGPGLLRSFRSMGTTLRNFFRRSITLQYPRVKRPLPGQWRGGTFALTFDPGTREENCIGCRLCEYICPSRIIKVTLRKGEKRENGEGATYADHFSLDYQACMQCELCVQVCPTDAIVMTRYLHECPYDRGGLFLSKEKLEENGLKLLERPELQSCATGRLLREWTAADRGLVQEETETAQKRDEPPLDKARPTTPDPGTTPRGATEKNEEDPGK